MKQGSYSSHLIIKLSKKLFKIISATTYLLRGQFSLTLITLKWHYFIIYELWLSLRIEIKTLKKMEKAYNTIYKEDHSDK